jgi:hypothetical protein
MDSYTFTVNLGDAPSVVLSNFVSSITGAPVVVTLDSTTSTDFSYTVTGGISPLGFDPQLANISSIIGDLTYVDGRPAVMYTITAGQQDVYYKIASDTIGQTWPAGDGVGPIFSQQVSLLGRVIDMKVAVDGFPMFAMVEQLTLPPRIYFPKATSFDASTMNPELFINNAGSGFRFIEMVVPPDGIPLLIITTSGSISGYKATDDQGTAFGGSFIISNDAFNRSLGSALVDGVPAIAYVDSAQQVRYKRSTNVAGTGWAGGGGTVVGNIDSFADADVYLTTYNNFPMVIYAHSTAPNGIYYLVADDVTGTAWTLGNTVQMGVSVPDRFTFSKCNTDGSFDVTYPNGTSLQVHHAEPQTVPIPVFDPAFAMDLPAGINAASLGAIAALSGRGILVRGPAATSIFTPTGTNCAFVDGYTGDFVGTQT